MDGRTELLSYMGAATATIVGLFTLQVWYASYLDVSHHDRWNGAPANAELKAVRDQEAQKLAGGRVSIDKAKEGLGQRGRRGFPQLAAAQSQDLGAMSGWIYAKGFKPYEPRQVAAPEPDPTEVVPPEGAEGAEVVSPEGAEVVSPDGTEGAELPAGEAPAAEAGPSDAAGADSAAPAEKGEAAVEAAPAEEK